MNNDLKKYSFQHYEDAINIGWNSQEGVVKYLPDRTFLERLKCHCDSPINVDYNGKFIEKEIEGHKEVFGFGEIRILDLKNKIRYAAPNTIYEEIMEGHYVPPTAFIEAVIASPLPTDKEYKEFMTRYSVDSYWGENEEKVQKINAIVNALLKGTEEFQEFLTDVSNIHIVTNKGSLLNHAILENKEKSSYMLIDKGIDINIFEGVELLSAIEKGLTGIAEILIEKNIEMNISELTMNPLVSAIRYHNNFIAKKLITKNSELIVTYSNEFVQGFTMMDVARRFDNEEIVGVLKTYGNHR